MSTRLCYTVMAASGVLFASVAVLRRPSTEADAPARAPKPATVVHEELGRVRPAASVTTPPPAPFWEDLGAHRETRSKTDPEAYRQKMMASTAAYLGLDAGEFRSVAVLSLMSIRDAWKARDAEVLSLSEFLEGEERERREQEIQDRYEAAKRQASDRLVSMLGTTARHEEFRNRLGEWIDAVR